MSDRDTDPRTVLLLDETTESETGEHCDALMRGFDSPRRAELVVSFPDDVTDRLDFSAASGGRQPAKRGFVTVGETMQAAGASDPDFGDHLVERAVPDPTDLQDLGQTVSRFCRAWSDAGYDVVVCFDSLTDLLVANDPELVVRFCHALSGRLDSVGAVAHFHLDPNEHAQDLQLTFEDLFDETLVEEVDVDRLVPTRRRRASAADVARKTETLDLDDPADGTDADTTDGTVHDEPASRPTRSGQASDDDVSDAVPD
ncbi:DUF7504 family protein [Haloarchaeobius sp. HRN-SO-5]|uniref:DUF7504 family protein n=1 Tax=Haloarchaeobius sp. HRN-SO-5 TaxID=3446118 RepID=UPI003EB93786